MSDSTSNPPPSPSQRRKSFVEMLNPRAFGNSDSNSLSTSPSGAVPPAPGVPASPAQRKSSISVALGLAGPGGASGNSQESPFNAFAKQRRASISTSSASGSPTFRNSFDENAIIEDEDKAGPINAPPSPSFARRLSFGAQALRDVRQSGTSATNNAGRRPSSSLFTLNEDSDSNRTKSASRVPGTAKTAGEGFNWSDSMRDRTKRASVASANPFVAGHNRSKSFNAPVPEPPKEITQQTAPSVLRSKKPDHLGERMLRGDFMMD